MFPGPPRAGYPDSEKGRQQKETKGSQTGLEQPGRDSETGS